MPDLDQRAGSGAGRVLAAFGVHLFTASGAALALLAMLAATEHRWTAMFTWLTVALVVDAVDGAFARLLHVKTVLPRWNGDVLDLVVDVLTYVFVPAYALAVSGLLPAALAWPLAVAIVVTGVLYFADGQMKSDDNHFVGFPAVWNLIAFLIFLLRPPATASAAVIVALCVLTFVPIRFVHPFRVERRRTLNLALLIAGMVLAGIALWRELDPGPLVAIPLCAIGLYFLAAGLLPRRL